MSNKKATKRALLTSVMALALCVVMLVGTTFAWFTDTAKTNVNKIQAGNLKVSIVDESGDNTLTNLGFVQAGAETTPGGEPVVGQNILWEPGCTFLTEGFKIRNDGNLALKYKLSLNGIEGDASLLKVIKFSVITKNADGTEGNVVDLDSYEGHLTPTANVSEALYIKAHMDETAGNEYMNQELNGITITVYATQDTVENDSYGPNYDENATYYPVIDMKGLDNALSIGGEVSVDADVTVYGTDSRMWRTMVTKPTTLTLNKKIISPDNMGDNDNNFAALFVCADTTINAGADGGIDTGVNGAYAINVMNGAKLVINGGSYYGGGTAVQVQKGELVINGGFFAVEPYSNPTYGNKFLLNCIDAALADGSAKITVYGGTFVNYDPSDSASENPHGNFVAAGYSVISETKANGDVWYTVVKGAGVTAGTQDELNTGITDSATKDVTVVMPENSSFTLDNGIANEGAKSRNVTFKGDGTQTVDVVTKAVNAEGGMLNYQRGSTFTFENVTVQAGEGTYDGIVCDELTYKNCTIKGKLTLYGKATFINCTFENNMANQYSIWTWGGTDVTFEGCTFNTNGKAILLFGEEKTTSLTVNNCIFNDRKEGAAEKAAIEVGEANYGKHNSFTLVVNNATVNGFADGKNTGSKIWANKNSMDAAHLSVTIDGSKVL